MSEKSERNLKEKTERFQRDPQKIQKKTENFKKS